MFSEKHIAAARHEKNIGDLKGISEIPAISPAIEGKDLNTE
jgi:hypothetical protein